MQSLVRCILDRPSQDSGWTKKKQTTTHDKMIASKVVREKYRLWNSCFREREKGRRKKKYFNIVYRNFKELIKSLQVSIICLIFLKVIAEFGFCHSCQNGGVCAGLCEVQRLRRA